MIILLVFDMPLFIKNLLLNEHCFKYFTFKLVNPHSNSISLKISHLAGPEFNLRQAGFKVLALCSYNLEAAYG